VTVDKGRKISAKIAAIYALVGGAWILFSDKLLDFLVDDPAAIIRVSLYKGWFYVAVTAAMLYLLIKRRMTLLIKSETALQERNEELAETEEELRQQIDEYHRSQAELHEANQALTTLFQASPLAIIALDPDCRVTQWNQTAERLFGWKAAELIGRPYPLFPSENAEEQARRFFEKTLQGEVLHDVEVRRQKKEGAQIDISLLRRSVPQAGKSPGSSS
jgi:hypothetical protein